MYQFTSVPVPGYTRRILNLGLITHVVPSLAKRYAVLSLEIPAGKLRIKLG